MEKLICKHCGKEDYPLLKYAGIHIGAYCTKCHSRDKESNWIQLQNLPRIALIKKAIAERSLGDLDKINEAKIILSEEGHFFDSNDIRNRTVAYSHLLAMISLLRWYDEA
jgi:NMD protein affecting ribosome stability and mRNA decay